jgi:ribosomal protein S18 acetylase RimI-like enzyme
MIEFSILPADRGREAYQWHRGFAAHNPHILPRPWQDYQRFADDGQVWCARDGSGDFLGLAYYAFDEKDIWELGGLMVAANQRRGGLGSTLVRLLLGHLLYMEDPLSLNHTVIVHVHAANTAVVEIVEKVLRFRRGATVEAVWYRTSELNDEETVTGYEFHLVKPSSLIALAEWCEAWNNKLPGDREAKIVFGQKAQNLRTWATAFRDMAR